MKKHQQLQLPFHEWTPEARRAANQQAWEQFIAKHHPITAEEEQALPEGIRLARLVPLAECESCPSAIQDHRLDKRSTILICLKDHLVKGEP